MLKKSSQFLPWEQPCELKSLDVALYNAGVEKISCLGKRVIAVNIEAILFEFWMKRAFVTVEMFVFCG